ncbi:MAG: pyridoxamine 5'-phosphate oxidase family protein [Caldiserica bacterium]|nr:pyridoxamine 5'-phosphate oxidase family protein [Caldisericota bacterium]
MGATEGPRRRKEREVTDTKVIRRILGRATLCRVAMVDGSEPYLVPMNCGWDGQHLLLHAAVQGRKVDILRANPRVCVEVDEDIQIVTGATGEECTANYVTVIGAGTVSFVLDPLVKARDLNVIVRQCHPGVSEEIFPDEALSCIVVLEVQFDHLTCKAKGTAPRS